MLEKRLITPQGFREAFEEELSYSRTNKEAFERVENRFESEFGFERYSSYNSFQTSYSKRRNKRRH